MIKHELNPLDLTLTVSLSESDENRMQLVYTSQVYQTFFCVFGAFDLDRSDPELLKLRGVYLQLINYKGIVNLGIIGVSDPLVTSCGLHINFKVKALSPSGMLKYYKFDEAKPIKNSNDLFFQRILEPIDTDVITGTTSDGFFDAEFYERDGLYNRKRTLRLDDDSTESFWNFDSESKRWHKAPNKVEAKVNVLTDNLKYHSGELIISKTDAPKAPGGRCPKSKGIAKY